MIMDLQIIKDEHKPLLNRREISAKVSFEGATPKREDIRKIVAAKLKADEKLVLVNRIHPEYGSQSAKLSVHIYDDDKSMRGAEYEYTLLKHGLAEKKEKKAEEKKEE
jgi:small subunit ribosomal protein S24e